MAEPTERDGRWVLQQVFARRLMVSGCKVHTDEAWIALFDEALVFAREEGRREAIEVAAPLFAEVPRLDI